MMKIHILKAISYISIFLLLQGCNLINPPEDIPSYIRIEKIDLSTTTEQGTNSHKITDAWVYVDDQTIGAFELPAEFPVLKAGMSEIKVRAGIKINGIAATRAYYPFYEPLITDSTLVPEKTISLQYTTQYYSDTKFPWIEDFEASGITIEKTSKSDTSIQTITDPLKVFEASACGVIYLTKDKETFEGKSLNAYNLPMNSKPVFLELNYKTNNIVTVGVFINEPTFSTQYPLLLLNPTSQWNKIYINLTNIVSRSPNAIDFNIFFGSVLEDGTESAEIYLDNIKLVHN